MAQLRLVRQIAPKSRYPQPVIFSVLCVELHEPIAVQKHQFGVVLGEDEKLDDLRVHAAFKFHGHVLRVVTTHAGFIGSSG